MNVIYSLHKHDLVAGMLEVVGIVRALQHPLLVRSCSCAEDLFTLASMRSAQCKRDISVVCCWRRCYPTHGASLHDVKQRTVDEMLP